MRFVIELALGIVLIGALFFVLSEALSERARQKLLRRRRAALDGQRQAIQRWVTEKRG